MWFSPKKQRFYMLFSFLSKCGTLYLVIIFCIIEYKNRCVRIKAPHISPDPRRHSIRVSPAAADTVPVLSSQLLCRILLTLFQNICGHGFFGWNTIVVFSLSESRTASTSTRSTQNAQDDGCGRMLGCICCMSSRSMAGSPLCLLCSFLRRPCICRSGIFCF